MHTKIGWLIVTVALAGCSAGGSPMQLEAPPQPVSQKNDQFKPYLEVTTPQVRVGALPTALGMTLNARIDRQTNQVQPLLRVEIVYTGAGKRNYDGARDSSANPLRTERVASNARCRPGAECTYDEVVLIDLPDAALRQARTTGYRLKLFARNGPEIEIGIPGPQIAGLYDKVNASSPSRPPPPSAKR